MDEFIKYVQECKISHAELARQLGCSTVYIHQIMNGRTDYPPSDNFRKKCYEWMKKCWVCGKNND